MEDSLEWVLDQFKGGKLPAMIERAGYPAIAANVDTGLVAEKIVEVESKIKAMVASAKLITGAPSVGAVPPKV